MDNDFPASFESREAYEAYRAKLRADADKHEGTHEEISGAVLGR